MKEVDFLYGAKAIGEYMGMTSRSVYHAAETGLLPICKVGNRLFARKSTLIAYVKQLEEESLTGLTTSVT
ncbi:hypothetical protein [Terasakiella pusilla]|uniref:hypothetical protein n=1 Tax=Terasakiella pusilla TaxID=64973 RepID=UPI003AA9917D